MMYSKDGARIVCARPASFQIQSGGCVIRVHYRLNLLLLTRTFSTLYSQFVYSGRHRNPGIHYNFYTPGEATITNFIWKQKHEGSCSATCAGGMFTMDPLSHFLFTHGCVEYDQNIMVENKGRLAEVRK